MNKLGSKLSKITRLVFQAKSKLLFWQRLLQAY